MKFDLGAVFGQLVALYMKQPLAQKIALPLFIAGGISAIVFISRWASNPEYSVLFSDLEEADAAAVVEKLKDSKVGFKIRNDGRTIDITPPEMVHQLRLELAAGGVPTHGKTGFEVFNESPLGRTGFVEEVTFVRALQGELERTIQTLDAVKSVRVHISKPKQSPFVKRNVDPTASVVLKLRAGTQLTPHQVKGITNLVANSVERLTPDNVSVVDTNGNLLNEKRDETDSSVGELTRLEYQKKIESYYVQRIKAMLEEVLGPGRVEASVSAIIDFNKHEKEEESYDPGGKVVRSERSVQEGAGQSAEGGVPGILSNLSNEPGLLTPPDSGKGNNQRTESVANYEISRAVTRTVAATGNVTRLSVAVLVDGQYVAPNGAAADAEKVYQALAPEMLKKIDNLVKQAVGFDSTRGDVVTVENIQFVEPETNLAAELSSADNITLISTILRWGAPTLVALLFFLFIVRPMVRFLTTPVNAGVDLTNLLPSGTEELKSEVEAIRSRSVALPSGAGGIDIEEIEELLTENSRFVKENPQQAALLIRYWLNEGKA